MYIANGLAAIRCQQVEQLEVAARMMTVQKGERSSVPAIPGAEPMTERRFLTTILGSNGKYICFINIYHSLESGNAQWYCFNNSCFCLYGLF